MIQAPAYLAQSQATKKKVLYNWLQDIKDFILRMDLPQ
jgi:hypothetical protein